MRQFLRLLILFLKYRLKIAAFWVSAGVLLLLFGSFALLCPAARPASAQIGLMYDPIDSALQSACAPLLGSDTLRFVYYPPESFSKMQRDVRTGALHCAYRINQNASSPPITVYENDGAFLTPVTDELIFAAWFETQLPQVTLAVAERLNVTDRQLILTEMRRLQAENIPLEPALTFNAVTPKASDDGMSLSPLLYAVLVPLFLLCVIFSALLSPGHERELTALLQLRCPLPNLPATAAALAQALLFAALPALCELLLLLLRIETGYSLTARLALIAVLALAAMLMAPVVSHLRPSPALLLAAVLWAAVSVIFSGAVISPEALGRFGMLKYLSPPWYLLRLMTVLS